MGGKTSTLPETYKHLLIRQFEQYRQSQLNISISSWEENRGIKHRYCVKSIVHPSQLPPIRILKVLSFADSISQKPRRPFDKVGAQERRVNIAVLIPRRSYTVAPPCGDHGITHERPIVESNNIDPNGCTSASLSLAQSFSHNSDFASQRANALIFFAVQSHRRSNPSRTVSSTFGISRPVFISSDAHNTARSHSQRW
jgi:hypothetical protein